MAVWKIWVAVGSERKRTRVAFDQNGFLGCPTPTQAVYLTHTNFLAEDYWLTQISTHTWGCRYLSLVYPDEWDIRNDRSTSPAPAPRTTCIAGLFLVDAGGCLNMLLSSTLCRLRWVLQLLGSLASRVLFINFGENTALDAIIASPPVHQLQVELMSFGCAQTFLWNGGALRVHASRAPICVTLPTSSQPLLFLIFGIIIAAHINARPHAAHVISVFAAEPQTESITTFELMAISSSATDVFRHGPPEPRVLPGARGYPVRAFTRQIFQPISGAGRLSVLGDLKTFGALKPNCTLPTGLPAYSQGSERNEPNICNMSVDNSSMHDRSNPAIYSVQIHLQMFRAMVRQLQDQCIKFTCVKYIN
ncbi:hypothetical protein AG1IA_00696 [Rhizoctonia solani AG-1 IA]|uniref:Uncharacterized protein n=1 Tax=Thanatephorus cucumeris (strain AG1-IA) TaxID=983506 RepID=L8X4S2_THACA|nr:hypothetical protein AG1IA_00696 [Rhizoctonia solani AG-1 IA]